MMNDKKMTHIDNKGKIKMVDVSHKQAMKRIAKASGRIYLARETILLIQDNAIQKGDVLLTAKVAGIQAAKQTSQLIPLCHPIPLTHMDVTISFGNDHILVQSEVRSISQTGVEMEALSAVSVALLTIYDMCKSVDKKMKIEEIQLLEKIKQDL